MRALLRSMCALRFCGLRLSRQATLDATLYATRVSSDAIGPTAKEVCLGEGVKQVLISSCPLPHTGYVHLVANRITTEEPQWNLATKYVIK